MACSILKHIFYSLFYTQTAKENSVQLSGILRVEVIQQIKFFSAQHPKNQQHQYAG